jgi:hypothetical protein
LWQLGRAEPLLVFDHLRRNESTVAASSASAVAAAASSKSDNPAFTSDVQACSFFRQNQLILLSHRNALLVYRYFIDPAKTNTDLKKSEHSCAALAPLSARCHMLIVFVLCLLRCSLCFSDCKT